MGSTIFKQYDRRWGSKPYAGDTMRLSGCGPSSMACIIHAVDTSINPYKVARWLTKHGYASNGSGTYWSGIKAGMVHYGFNVKNHAKMTDFFKAMLNNNEWGILLFRGGSKGGVTWTLGGHFLAVRDIKKSNGKHYLLMADPGGRNHDGWYCYETTMKGLILQAWSCKPQTTPKKKASSKKKSNTSAKPSKKVKKHIFEAGKTYILKDAMNVRSSAGGSQKLTSQLTSDGKKHAYSQKWAVLKKGTKVTVLDVVYKGAYTWVKIPSGWVCAQEGSTIYIK